MSKLMNDPNNYVDDMLKGFLKCHADEVIRSRNQNVILRKNRRREDKKVAVVSGGGCGHLPAFIGYVKPGLLDAAAMGTLFQAPPAEVFLDAFRQADQGAGVICIYGNYALDCESVEAAARTARQEGIQVETVCTNDDIATMSKEGDRSQSRGLSGEVLLWKIAGAAAEQGMGLGEIKRLCDRANKNTRSIGAAFSACIRPEIGIPNFDVMEGTMEFGIGHHGDPGMSTYKMRSADGIADLIMEEILKTYSLTRTYRVVVLISSLGATTQGELYVLYSRIADILAERNIVAEHVYIGDYFTSLDMEGVSVTVMEVDDQLEQLIHYKDHSCL